MEQFKVGDVVVLKSGNYPMTVESPSDGDVVKCVWHDSSGIPRRDVFQAVMLRKVDGGGPRAEVLQLAREAIASMDSTFAQRELAEAVLDMARQLGRS